VSEVAVRTPSGASAGTIELDPHWFGITPNGPVMHQVVVAQLAKRRSGTQSTKTRAEISRSGAKSRRQKGGGTSRQGSMRGPQWVGGGVALGPRPRSYAQRTPKKMINLALRSALSDRAGDGRVVVVSEWAFATPKTKDALVALKALGIEGRALVVLNGSNDGDVRAARSFGNLQEVQLIDAGELNAYDVLVNDYIVFTSATVPGQTKNEQQQALASEETA
jgi:large subunit ribosomal protein L4